MRKSQSAMTDIFHFIGSGGIAGFELYLSRGGNKNIQCSDGTSMLMYSIKLRDKDLFDFCLKNDVDHYLRDSKGNTVYHIAADHEDTYFIKSLLDYTVDINCQNEYGNTPLMSSILSSHPESMCLLLERNCDLNLRNKDGNTALHLLIVNNKETQLISDINTHVLRDFFQNNTTWTCENLHYAGGCTPLMCAVSNKELELVDFILSCCKTEYFADDLLQLFVQKNQCFKQVFLLKGVDPCININNVSILAEILQLGTINDLHCIVQNYSLATSSTYNGLLKTCFGSQTRILPYQLIDILIKCGLQLTKMSSFIKLSKKLCLELDEVLINCENVPVSLKAQSRTAVRKYFHGPVQECVLSLPLPRSVKKYILFFNEFTCKFNYNVNKYFKDKMILK